LRAPPSRMRRRRDAAMRDIGKERRRRSRPGAARNPKG
jgi:hypothetical protein